MAVLGAKRVLRLRTSAWRQVPQGYTGQHQRHLTKEEPGQYEDMQTTPPFPVTLQGFRQKRAQLSVEYDLSGSKL